MSNRVRISIKMRQLYDETQAAMTAAERMKMLQDIGKQQAIELRYRKLTIKKNREIRKEKVTKPAGGKINPGLARYLESQQQET